MFITFAFLKLKHQNEKEYKRKHRVISLKKELEQYLKIAEKFNFPKKEIQKQIDLYLDDINQKLRELKNENGSI